MKISEKSLALMVFAALASAAATPVAANTETGAIQVVSALYGPVDTARPINFVSRLQQTCGDASTYCEVFCSNALMGHSQSGLRLPFSPHTVCRVIYRCGAQSTVVTDAEKNDLLVMSCRQKF